MPSSPSEGDYGSGTDSSGSDFVMIPKDDQYMVNTKIVKLPVHYPKSRISQLSYYQPRTQMSLVVKSLRPIAADSTAGHEDGLQILVVTGLGGAGKTELALRFLQDYKHKFEATFFLTADSSNRLLDQCGKISVRQLKLLDPDNKPSLETCRAAFRTWLADPIKSIPDTNGEFQRVTWCLILDNAENIEDIDQIVPGTGTGCILVTTRNPLFGYSWRSGVDSIELKGFTPDEGAELLRTITREEPNTKNEGPAKKLAERLDGLPLAISQIGHIMVSQKLSIFRFVETYDKESDLYDLFDKRLNRKGYEHSIASVWAFKDLQPAAFAILSLVAMLDSEGIPESLLEPGHGIANFPMKKADLHQLNASLADRSTIEIDPDDGKVRVHRLVQAVVRSMLETQGILDKAFENAVERVSQEWPFLNRNYVTGAYGKIDRWEQCEDILPHVLYLKDIHEGMAGEQPTSTSRDLAELLLELAQFRLERGEYHDVISLIDYSESIYKRFDPSSIEEDLGKLYRARIGLSMRSLDPQTCLYYARLGLEIEDRRRQKLGADSSILAVAYNDMAMGYGLNREWEMAIPMLKRSREIRQRLPGFTKDKLYSPSLQEALIRYYEGEYAKAGQILKEARIDRQEILGSNDNSIRTAALYYLLGNVKWALGDFQSSFAHHEEAYSRAKRTVGATNHNTLACKFQVARHFAHTQNYTKAARLLKEVLEKSLDYPLYQRYIARAAFLYAECCQKNSEMGDAFTYRSKSLKIYNNLVPSRTRTLADFCEADAFGLVIYDSLL